MRYFNLLKSKFIQNFLYLYFGNMISAGFNFMIMVLIARYLGPNNFGNFSLIFTILSIITIISDFGLSISIVKFSSEYYSKKDYKKVEDLLKFTFKIRLIISVVICIIGIILANTISKYLFNNQEHLTALVLVFIGGIGLTLYEFMKTYFHSRQEFKKYALYLILYPVLNLILILFLIIFNSLTIFSGILALTAIPTVIFLINLFINKRNFITFKKTNFEYKKVMSFNFYIIIMNFCSMLFNRIEVFYLNFFLDSSDVGIYSAALQMAFIMSIITNSLTTVLLPKISRLDSLEHIRNSFKKIVKYSSFLYLITLPIVSIAPIIIPLFFSNNYLESIPIFQLLIFSFGMSFIINPLSIVMYKINKPNILTIVIIIQSFIVIVGNPLFIILFNVFGVAYISIITHSISLIFLNLYLYKKLFFRNQI